MLSYLLVMAMAAAGARGETVRVHCLSTKGEINIDVHPEWAPLGAARFLELVEKGHYDNIGLPRCNGDIVQFGEDWEKRDAKSVDIRHKNIMDDPKPPGQKANRLMLKRGQLSYAGGGPNTRSSSIFFVVKPNEYLGRAEWEVPFGEVVGDGMKIVDQFYRGYGDFGVFKCPTCNAPDLSKYWTEGNSYLKREFPKLDFMLKCSIMEKGPDVSQTHNAQAMPHPPSPPQNEGIPHGVEAYGDYLWSNQGSVVICFLIAVLAGVAWARLAFGCSNGGKGRSEEQGLHVT
ncbi:hypothetical protein AAMO2058_000188700 [Amorphochlora amoebiformis]|uniref:peptidylprolyl isomerase n=1 Tax=Amorphochlora amoebiformis TaxID=1561963 RepID=A0A7S0GXW1_9EUKA|mmetsp:Transcript_25492/g.40254  ORF Transcript_25492/g.40254 Transcript_25492/m.40254 type:complete len:288 (+) Transcript_25492:32-895(+)